VSGEKTEKPTPKRLKEARREGRVARSQDVGAWAAMLAASLLLQRVVTDGAERTGRLMVTVAALIREPDSGQAVGLLGRGFGDAVWIVAPLALGLLLVGVLGSAVQGGVHAATKQLKPQLKRLNPFTGLKRVAGPQALWEAAKAVLKTAVLGVVLWRSIDRMLPVLAGSGALPLGQVLRVVWAASLELVRNAAVAGLVMAAADYAVQRRRIGKGLRMSLHEVKQENKQSEGDPHVKGQIRSRQMAMSRNRMMTEVGKADVVVVNPTHVAVALRYDPVRGAPRVVAKGAGAVAARIRAEAEAHRVPLVQDVPLARALHRACELGQEIPADLYTAVARVLAFVLSLKARGSASGLHRPSAFAS